MNLFEMDLKALREYRKKLAADKSKQARLKRQALIKACDAWIARRMRESRAQQ